MSEYGPLSWFVAIAGNLAAAAFALRAMWAGTTGWEPDIRDFPRAPTRVAGLAGMVGIAIAVASSRYAADHWPIVPWASALAGVTVVALLADITIRTALIVRCDGEKEGIIGGLWRTQRANEILRGEAAAYARGDLADQQPPPGSVQDLYCNSGRVPARIWPPLAQGLARALIVLAFVAWTGAGTLALACGSLVLGKILQ